MIPVHLFGQPVDITGFEDLAAERGLLLLFDAAQAHGATFGDAGIGGRGAATAWSFYPGKNLGALGDAGAVTTNDHALAGRLRRLRDYGRTSRHAFAEIGSNSRLDELQAAVLRVKLEHLDEWNVHRTQLANRYRSGLSDASLQLPEELPGRRHVWHQFVVRTAARDELMRTLAAEGIQTGIHYPIPPHRQAPYAGQYEPLPLADRLADESLSLPMGLHISAGDADAIVSAILRTAV